MPCFCHVDFPFDIPDTWWFKAEMAEFQPKAPQYRADLSDLDGQTILSVCVGKVEPLRSRKLNNGYGLFSDEERVVKILRGFIENTETPPVQVVKQPPGSDYVYRLYNGTHRFYCSVAAGFSHVPAEEVTPSSLLPQEDNSSGVNAILG